MVWPTLGSRKAKEQNGTACAIEVIGNQTASQYNILQPIVTGRVLRVAWCVCRSVCLSVLSCLVPSVCCCVGIYYGQMVGWIKMKLDVQVDLGPGHIVLDGDPTPPPLKGDCSVLFCSLAFLDPRVGHTMDVLSPFISILCHSD